MKQHALCVIIAAMACLRAGQAMASDDSWYPSKYGKDDTIGAANNLSPVIVKKAAGLVTTGKVYSLGMVLDAKAPPEGRPYHIIVTSAPAAPSGPNKVVSLDDFIHVGLGKGTSMDGLAHVGMDGRYYNGIKPNASAPYVGLDKLGTENVPPIVSRGILLDMASYFGARMLDEGVTFNKAEIMGAARRQKVDIRKGDVVLLHTGRGALIKVDNERYLGGYPGLGEEGAHYLADLGVVMVGSDAPAVEVYPHETDKFFPVHQILATQNGVYMLEATLTAELAADKAYEFLFVMSWPRFKGAVQAAVNPIAIR